MLHGSSAASTSKNTVSPLEDIVFGLLVLGIAFVFATGRDRPLEEHRRARTKRKLDARRRAGKPTESLPMRLLRRGNPWVTFGVGAIVSYPGVSYLDALDHIHKLDAGTVASVALVVGFCVMQQLILEVPLLGYVFSPERTQTMVGGFRAWMRRSGRTAVVIAAAVIGVWLVARGVINLV